MGLLAAEWPQFRGPDGQGHSEAENVPLTWSETENVVWKTALPGRGHSSPVVVDDTIWMTTAYETEASSEEQEERLKENTGGQKLIVLSHVSLHLLGVDRNTGALRANIKLMQKDQPQWVHKLNSYASPTPIYEDGKLYCHFGSYGTACVDEASGKVLWTNQEKALWVMHENGPGGSPELHGEALIFHLDGSDRQLLAALNKADGRLLWTTARSGEMHENPQFQKAYASPLMVDGTLVSPAANWVYGYDPATGDEQWKVPYGQLGFSNVARPVAGHDMVFVSTCFMKAVMLAIDLSGDTPKEVWRYSKGVPKMPSPILVGNELYFTDDKIGITTCLDAKTGEEHWRERFGGSYSASPVFADGRLYFPNQEGKTVVIKPGKTFERLAENTLDGRQMASFAVVDGGLFIRTDVALYQIGE